MDEQQETRAAQAAGQRDAERQSRGVGHHQHEITATHAYKRRPADRRRDGHCVHQPKRQVILVEPRAGAPLDGDLATPLPPRGNGAAGRVRRLAAKHAHVELLRQPFGNAREEVSGRRRLRIVEL